MAVGNKLQERSEVWITKWLKYCTVESEFLDGKDKKSRGEEAEWEGFHGIAAKQTQIMGE